MIVFTKFEIWLIKPHILSVSLVFPIQKKNWYHGHYDNTNACPLLSLRLPVPLCFPLPSMQAIQNLGLAVISLTAGIIVDQNGYLILEVFFMAWLCRELHVSPSACTILACLGIISITFEIS